MKIARACEGLLIIGCVIVACAVLGCGCCSTAEANPYRRMARSSRYQSQAAHYQMHAAQYRAGAMQAMQGGMSGAYQQRPQATSMGYGYSMPMHSYGPSYLMPMAPSYSFVTPLSTTYQETTVMQPPAVLPPPVSSSRTYSLPFGQ